MSSNRLAVEVRGLSKRYLISHQEKHRYLGDALLAKLKSPFAKPAKEEFWALKDVSFDVEKGEVLGVIGRNGAGKSTMLKILSQIADPTAGEILMHGRVGSLLEVGTGFHPELTGRENVFLNGTILGMRKRDVERKFDEIVAFAEVERFIDTPVKRYSSGMYVRLAFAVAANLTPEILIVDEVLAVGDAQFQAKCLGKMHDIAQGEGRTVLFVSHNIAAVRALCTKAVLLTNGRMDYFGDVARALEIYEVGADLIEGDRIVDRAKIVNEGIVLESVTVNGSQDTSVALQEDSRLLDIVLKGYAERELNARFGLSLLDSQGLMLACFGEGLLSGEAPRLSAGPFEWRARIELPRNMTAGDYVLSMDIAEHGVQVWVSLKSAVQIQYVCPKTGRGEILRYSDRYGLLVMDGSVYREGVLADPAR